MAKLKYSKYFLNELSPEERQKGFGRMPTMVAFTDNDIIEGSHYFSVMVMGEQATKSAGHGPHTHNTPEVLVALGTDPDNPKKLGAEIELCMGPEMESHIITESTLVYIPANFIHCPFRILKVDRPFLFIQSQYSPKLTETSLKKLVAEELRDKMVFIDADGTQKE
jgi:hypothetical protein